MAKCVEIKWGIVPFRDQKFIDLWTPYAEVCIDYGASGYTLLRSLDDCLVVSQFCFFENKADWERYWYSDRLSEGRQKVGGLFQVPITYVWHQVETQGSVR